MTRSTRSVQTLKESKKAFKASAVEAGIEWKPEIYALWNQVVADIDRVKARKPPLVSARNPRRMDGVKWKGSAFVCPTRVNDGDVDEGRAAHDLGWGDERHDDGDVGAADNASKRVVCLLDMARPGKLKGIRKEFEVVDNLPRVIVLEDDEGSWGYWEFPEEDWEEILVEGVRPFKKSFAEVLREGG